MNRIGLIWSKSLVLHCKTSEWMNKYPRHHNSTYCGVFNKFAYFLWSLPPSSDHSFEFRSMHTRTELYSFSWRSHDSYNKSLLQGPTFLWFFSNITWIDDVTNIRYLIEAGTMSNPNRLFYFLNKPIYQFCSNHVLTSSTIHLSTLTVFM